MLFRSLAFRYPHEREILFAPLTGLEVQGSRVEGSVLVVEVKLSVNLTSLRIEQVIGKRKKMLQDMAPGLEAEVVQEENATKAELEEVRAEIERLNNIVRLLKTSSEDSALQAEILKDENKALQAQNESLLEEQRKIKESLPAVEPAPIPNDKSSSSTPVKEARPWYDLIIKFPKSPVEIGRAHV